MTLLSLRTSTLSLAAIAAITLAAASVHAQQTYPSDPNASQQPTQSQPYSNAAPQQGYPQQQPPGSYPQQQPGSYPQQPSSYPQQQPNAYPDGARPQQQGAYPDHDRRDADRDDAPQNWSTDQIITATVHQAWILSGKDEANFFEIVRQLAEISARNRNLMLPDDPAAGRRAGEYIKEQAKADHDQLLYEIVDKSVRMTGRPMGPEAAQNQ